MSTNETPTNNALKEIIIEYKTKPHTPELLTKMFKAIWKYREDKLRKNKVDIILTVQDCPLSQAEIEKLESEGRKISYLPPELSAQSSRHLMAKIWPKMKHLSCAKGNLFENNMERFGWFDYEGRTDFVNSTLTEPELVTLFEQQGRLGMNLNEYIVASQDSKLFTRNYLDQNTWSRLPGTRVKGKMVDACFGNFGLLIAYRNLEPGFIDPRLGGRSVKYH